MPPLGFWVLGLRGWVLGFVGFVGFLEFVGFVGFVGFGGFVGFVGFVGFGGIVESIGFSSVLAFQRPSLLAFQHSTGLRNGPGF